MRRHAESNNIVLLVNLLEFKRDMALVAINNQQPMRPYGAIFYIRIEMLQLGNAKLIRYPAIIAYYHNPVQWYIVTLILYREIVLAYKDNKQRDSPSTGINSLDYRRPFAIAWLYYFQTVAPLRARYNYAY